MSENFKIQPPVTFWIIAVAALVWNLIGMYFYYLQVTLDPLNNSALTDAQQVFLANYASWATSAFAIAVTAGVVASVLLLMRKAFAIVIFVVSLVAVLLQNVYAFGIADGLAVWGGPGTILPGLIIAIGIALIYYSKSARSKGWIN